MSDKYVVISGTDIVANSFDDVDKLVDYIKKIRDEERKSFNATKVVLVAGVRFYLSKTQRYVILPDGDKIPLSDTDEDGPDTEGHLVKIEMPELVIEENEENKEAILIDPNDDFNFENEDPEDWK